MDNEAEGPGLRIGVVGAPGAVGQEILNLLDLVSWRPATVVALARTSSSADHVNFGDERLPVDDVADEALDGLDAVILAVPPDAAESIGREALSEGVPVVDVSGRLAETGELPLVVPWINPEALLEDRPDGVALPSADSLLLASILGPLRRAGLIGATRATLLLPASVWGRDAIDELAGQVRALFNQETPPRRVFESGLAFDLLPVMDPAAELAASREVARLVGVEPESIELDRVGVPVFSGVSATITVETHRRLDANLVTRLLADGGVHLAESEAIRDQPRPRKVEGAQFAHVGGVRVRGEGTLRLWASMDNLRTTAAAAVSATAALLRTGVSSPD